jgi:hypothetical protein
VREAVSTPGRRWGLVAVAGGFLFIAAAELDRRRLAGRRAGGPSHAD